MNFSDKYFMKNGRLNLAELDSAPIYKGRPVNSNEEVDIEQSTKHDTYEAIKEDVSREVNNRINAEVNPNIMPKMNEEIYKTLHILSHYLTPKYNREKISS